jgi:ribosome-associated translation inhibitor RaiA
MINPPFVPEFNFSADGFVASADLTAVAELKAAKLRRHAHPPIGSIRVRVARETPHSGAPRFLVYATAHRPGADCIVHSAADEPLPALDAAFRKLERAVAGVAGEMKSERRHPHAVELVADLPKV